MKRHFRLIFLKRLCATLNINIDIFAVKNNEKLRNEYCALNSYSKTFNSCPKVYLPGFVAMKIMICLPVFQESEKVLRGNSLPDIESYLCETNLENYTSLPNQSHQLTDLFIHSSSLYYHFVIIHDMG